MCRGRRCGAALLILVVTLLAACRMSLPPTALPTSEVSPTKPSPISIPSPFTPTSSCPSSGSITVSLTTPQPADVVLELAWEGGFTRPELVFAFGRVPEFSLLADGNAYYRDPPEWDEAKMMVAHLTPAERQELVQRVLDLGIERLESYTDACQLQALGSCLCVADAGESVLWVRLPGGKLREIRNYHTFANEPEVLEAIRTLLQDYRHPQAEAYQPDKAAFFIRRVSPPSDVPVRDWPLDPAWLTGGKSDYPCATTLFGSDLQALLAVTERNMGDFYFRDADVDQVYSIYLVPWLPGVDYTDLIASSGQACPPTEVLTAALPTPVPLPGMPQPGATLTRPMNKDEMNMCYVPAGPFTMGSPEGVGESIEHPQHIVTLNAFWIDETEMTQAHYETCVAAGVCDVPPMDDYALSGKPVVVTWDVAQAYCHWVGGRLPTEPEWEKAARGSDARTYPWGEEQPDCSRANHASLTGFCAGGPVDAGAYPAGASPYGVLDMAGNVAEGGQRLVRPPATMPFHRDRTRWGPIPARSG